MKKQRNILLTFLGVVGVIAGVILILWWVYFMKPLKEHEGRIKTATALIAAYSPVEWKELYDECMLLNEPKTFWNENGKTRPKRVAELNPHNIWIDDGLIHIGWTGGFDEFVLSIEVLQKARPDLGDDYKDRGVRVMDTRVDQDWQYVYRTTSVGTGGG